MTQDKDPQGHWGGYSFADGFGVSVFLSAEAQAEYRTQRNEPNTPIDGDVQEIRKQMDARNNKYLLADVAGYTCHPHCL